MLSNEISIDFRKSIEFNCKKKDVLFSGAYFDFKFKNLSKDTTVLLKIYDPSNYNLNLEDLNSSNKKEVVKFMDQMLEKV